MEQAEVDKLVDRIKLLIALYGADSEILTAVRNWYTAFARCPEAGAFVALEAEVAKIETHDEEISREVRACGRL